MEPVVTRTGTASHPSVDPVLTVRNAIRRLHALESSSARRLETLAFLLARVADADRVVTEAERRRMEDVVTVNGGVPAELAALLVEIATHRQRMADPGGAYRLSRELRLGADDAELEELLDCLLEVAGADGLDPREWAELNQVAAELGVGRSLASG